MPFIVVDDCGSCASVCIFVVVVVACFSRVLLLISIDLLERRRIELLELLSVMTD